MRRRKKLTKTNRHSPARRVKWWLRAKWRWFRGLSRRQQIVLAGAPVLLIVLVVPLLTYAYFAITMGDMDQLMNRNNTGVVLKDVHGEIFFSTGTAKHRDLVPLEDISKNTQLALIASEDKNFYKHGGVSLLSTLRAVYGYAFSGGGSFGGSTLTQQLAKMTLLSSNRSFLRQYQAFSVALAIEDRYSKDEILTMYLNSAYFGNNAFGIEQAAENYFGKKPNELTLAESSMLIGLLPAPSAYSPVTGDKAKGEAQQAEVLKRMYQQKMITGEERGVALAEELSYQEPAILANDAPHFTEAALKELYRKYGEEVVERSGFQVTTTLDLNLQRQALTGVDKQIGYINRMGGSNVGLVAIDPKTGGIRALVGSVDYGNEDWGKVNMVATKRQPASTFKPIYYAAALADGEITPATIIKDEPININGYQPKNATRQHYGDVTVRQALARSLNIPAVKIMQLYGIDKSVDAAKKMGITSIDKSASQYGLSLAIGSVEVSLQEMTGAYAAFANNGNVVKRTTINEIQNKFDKPVFSSKAVATRGVSPQGAYLISSILADQEARSFMFGSSLNIPGKTVAVKTGTTDDNRDAWAIGYTPDIAIGVWVGNNDNSEMASGGSDMAGPVWRQTMQFAIGDRRPAFERPSNIVERFVCYGSGGLADSAGSNTYSEVFLDSALPSGSCQATQKKQEEEKPPVKEEDTNPPKTDPVPTDPPEDDDHDADEDTSPEEPDDTITP